MRLHRRSKHLSKSLQQFEVSAGLDRLAYRRRTWVRTRTRTIMKWLKMKKRRRRRRKKMRQRCPKWPLRSLICQRGDLMKRHLDLAACTMTRMMKRKMKIMTQMPGKCFLLLYFVTILKQTLRIYALLVVCCCETIEEKLLYRFMKTIHI